ncbi:MAG TPA: DUF3300 domain-containing protein [Vicinamibacterales bacterium]|nr:DUF3300 domain-containing protein [Vicinamibacterales bacterium]
MRGTPSALRSRARKELYTRTFPAVILCGLLVLGGCGNSPATPEAKAASPAAARSQTPHDVDSLLAPIALYPDSLLAQILMCTGDPASVTKLDGWLKANAKLKGTELQDAAVLAGFEPSFVALALFPQVVASMAAKIDWTTLVGQIFGADKATVFNSIQKLRKQAQAVGSLTSTAQQQIEHQTTSAGEDVIVIEPTNPQVIYVPQYNPTTIYTTAPPVATTTTVIVEKDNSADAAVAGMIGFTAGIAIGAAVNNSYYYGPYGWHGGGYMYNDAWNDYYDAREDAREDWQDHREDLSEERGDRRENTQEQRTERAENRNENRPQSQERRDQAKSQAQTNRANGTSASGATTQSRSAGSSEARGNGGRTATTERSGTSSNAFSGYSSGKSERAASSRGSSSRGSSSRSSGGGGRRR